MPYPVHALFLQHKFSHHPDNGGNKLLWNFDQYLPDYTTQHPRRQPSRNHHIYARPPPGLFIFSSSIWSPNNICFTVFTMKLRIQNVPFKTQPWLQHMNTFKQRRNKWQYSILAAVSRCCSLCTAWNRYGRSFSCSVARWVFVIKTSCVPKFCFLAVYCCLIRYFLVRICITICFTNSSKRFRYEVWQRMNTWSAREYTMFAPAQLLRNWHEQRLRSQGDLDSVSQGRFGESITRGGPASDFILYRSTLLLLGWVVNGTPWKLEDPCGFVNALCRQLQIPANWQ
jgi:hypothetical protein